MKPGPYVVWKRDRYGAVFLRLDGPFQYPAWMSNMAHATTMSGPRAAWWSSLEGGLPLHVASETIAQAPARLETPGVRVEELAPTTQREGGDPTVYGPGYAYDDYSD